MIQQSLIIVWLIIPALLLCGCQSLEFKSGPSVSSIALNDDKPQIEATFSKSELLFSSAKKFEKAGQIEEAIKLYEKAIGVSSGNKAAVIEANRHLAVLYDLSDQPKKSRTAFQLAMERGTPDAELFNDYGYFLLKNQEFLEATQVLGFGHQKYPQNHRISTNLGMALVSSGQVENGYRLFESVVGETDAAANVGAVLLQQGKVQEGKDWLQRATAAGHKNTTASQMLRFANRNDSVR